MHVRNAVVVRLVGIQSPMLHCFCWWCVDRALQQHVVTLFSDFILWQVTIAFAFGYWSRVNQMRTATLTHFLC